MDNESQSDDSSQADKIARLIKTLHETVEELRQLAGDGLDTILHPDGALYMMPAAQAYLKQSERIQRQFADERAAILDSLPAHIVLLDEDGAIVAVNDRWRSHSVANDYSGENGLIGQNYIAHRSRMMGGPSEDTLEAERGIRAVLGGSSDKFTMQYTCHTPTEQQWFSMAVTPVKAGVRRGAVVMHFDVTERVLADERANLYRSRLERLVDQSIVGIMVERDGKPLMVNPMFAKMLGYETPDVILSLADTLQLFDPAEHERLSVYAAERRSNGSAPDLYRVIGKTSTGLPITLEARTFVIKWDEEDAICSMFTDLTKQIENEDRARQSERLQAIGQLTGGVAHDFNNLLTVVLGNAEVLSEELSDQPRLQSLADTTASAAVRGAELTNQLLAFSRKQPLNPKVMDVKKLIQEMDSLLRRTLPATISIEIIHSAGLWHAEIDSGQLESALLNLALNSRDAMPDGGVLTIAISNAVLDDAYVGHELDVEAGQYVQIVVTDTGAGIAPETVGRIFEPFFSTKEVGKGTGLGLSMVYGFVKQSGGHIRVYSEVGEGTSFKLYFPRSQAPLKDEHTFRIEQNIAGGRETILVVEDNDLVREHVVAQLKSFGYRIFQASAGAEALEILQKAPEIDLLFSDVVIPGGMSGRVLADAALRLRPEIKVLFTSGYTENSIVHNGILNPGVELLSKPYRRAELASKLRKVLDQD
ncbi:MAG: response regulator [Loktanella sp.]|nr:response regulator [Loktanella sp.]